MERTWKAFKCDLCGYESIGREKIKKYNIPVRHTCDDNEGRWCTPYYTSEQVDLCDECIEKVCVCNIGFRGIGLSLIEKDEKESAEKTNREEDNKTKRKYL